MINQELLDVMLGQLKTLFFLTEQEAIEISRKYAAVAEQKTLKCLEHADYKYFHGKISPFHSVMYCNFLYWVSHLAYLDGALSVAEKVYYLNKTLNCAELFYASELPEIWLCEHPLGSVMGRAKYGNYFFFYQGCTVGTNRAGGGDTRKNIKTCLNRNTRL